MTWGEGGSRLQLKLRAELDFLFMLLIDSAGMQDSRKRDTRTE